MDNQSEIDQLRKLLGEANAEIAALKTARFDDFALQELSCAGAAFYTKKWCNGMPLDERTRLFNSVAHGIVMGWRKCESMRGAPQVESILDKIAVAAVELMEQRARLNEARREFSATESIGA